MANALIRIRNVLIQSKGEDQKEKGTCDLELNQRIFEGNITLLALGQPP